MPTMPLKFMHAFFRHKSKSRENEKKEGKKTKEKN